MKRTFSLLALLAVLCVGAGAWHYQRIRASAPQARPLAEAPTQPGAAALMGAPPSAQADSGQPAAPQAASAAPKVEEVEPGDAEPTLDRILPRRSAGHMAGLNKTPDALGLDSSAAMVVDANTRQVVFAKNEEADLPMASITKLMTGLVIAEARLPMDAQITITEDDVDNALHSRSRLRVGTVLSRSEALHLALMSSENRAAHALGRTWPQGLQAFVTAMNAKAQQLGMTNTVYADPTGLSSRNRSSPRDLTALVVAASRHPVLRDYSTSPQYMLQEDRKTLRYVNSNRLVRAGGWDIDLQKTGYIIEAGHCVAMRTRIAGRDLVMVLMDADNNASRWADADRIRRWIDPNYEPPKPKASPARGARSKAKAKPGERQRVRRTFSVSAGPARTG